MTQLKILYNTYLFNFLSSPNGQVIDLTIVRQISKPGEVFWENNVTLNGSLADHIQEKQQPIQP